MGLMQKVTDLEVTLEMLLLIIFINNTNTWLMCKTFVKGCDDIWCT